MQKTTLLYCLFRRITVYSLTLAFFINLGYGAYRSGKELENGTSPELVEALVRDFSEFGRNSAIAWILLIVAYNARINYRLKGGESVEEIHFDMVTRMNETQELF